jgi:hypothetical protein
LIVVSSRNAVTRNAAVGKVLTLAEVEEVEELLVPVELVEVVEFHEGEVVGVTDRVMVNVADVVTVVVLL